MTLNEFITLVKNPHIVNESYIDDLKELINYYPYLVQARVLLSKALHDSKNLNAQNYIHQTSLYCSDRRWFYYYLYEDKKINTEIIKIDRTPKYSGNYFDVLTKVESESTDTKQSLKILAERLKSARSLLTQQVDNVKTKNDDSTIKSNKEIPTMPNVEYFNSNFSTNEDQNSEIYAKKLISEKKFSEAIEILKNLNLNNPKKSIYFADQIRFLEKVVTNSKK